MHLLFQVPPRSLISREICLLWALVQLIGEFATSPPQSVHLHLVITA